MNIILVCDSLMPAALIQSLRRAGIPAERRPMSREYPGPGRQKETDMLTGCGADFAILLEGRPLVGLRRIRQDDAMAALLESKMDPGNGFFLRMEKLQSFPIRLLVLEGRLSGKFHTAEPALYSFQYWCFRNHLFVFHTPDLEGSASMLEVLVRKMQLSLHWLEAPEWACAAGRI